MNSSTKNRFVNLALAAALALTGAAAHAQHHDDHGHDNHGHDYRHDDRHHDGPPDWHFGNDDRGRFDRHYRSDAMRWRGRRNRPHFERGAVIPRNYVIRAVPSSYYRGAPPPPPGYRYGYYDGYVVSYNPLSRIVADVLDLATQ